MSKIEILVKAKNDCGIVLRNGLGVSSASFIFHGVTDITTVVMELTALRLLNGGREIEQFTNHTTQAAKRLQEVHPDPFEKETKDYVIYVEKDVV